MKLKNALLLAFGAASGFGAVTATLRRAWNGAAAEGDWKDAEERNSLLLLRDTLALRRYNTWMTSLDSVKEKSAWAKKRAVDRLIRQTVTVLPPAALIVCEKGYLASPAETLSLGHGTKEDIAVLRHFALRHLGVKPR